MAKQPYIPIYPGDWERDANCLKSHAEFALFKLTIKLNDAKNKGVYVADFDTLSTLFKCDLATAERSIKDLKTTETLEIEYLEDGVVRIESRRILREKAISETRSEIGKTGGRGHKSKPKAKVKQTESKTKAKPKQITEYDNDNEYVIETVINYLNTKASTDFKISTKATQVLISARVKDGYGVDDFKTVIDKKTKEWLPKPDMVVYLRPETLFGNKFEGYLNQIESQAPPGQLASVKTSKAEAAITSHQTYMQEKYGSTGS
jgi:uncharacterized phage protein (TIGR02220 family)